MSQQDRAQVLLPRLRGQGGQGALQNLFRGGGGVASHTKGGVVQADDAKGDRLQHHSLVFQHDDPQLLHLRFQVLVGVIGPELVVAGDIAHRGQFHRALQKSQGRGRVGTAAVDQVAGYGDEVGLRLL